MNNFTRTLLLGFMLMLSLSANAAVKHLTLVENKPYVTVKDFYKQNATRHWPLTLTEAKTIEPAKVSTIQQVASLSNAVIAALNVPSTHKSSDNTIHVEMPKIPSHQEEQKIALLQVAAIKDVQPATSLEKKSHPKPVAEQAVIELKPNKSDLIPSRQEEQKIALPQVVAVKDVPEVASPVVKPHRKPVVEQTVIELKLNQGDLFPIPRDVDTFYLTSPETADFQIRTPGLMYLMAKKIGTTTLMGVDKSGTVIAKFIIHVGYDLNRLREIVSSSIGQQPIMIKQFDGNIILRGTVKTASDAQVIKQIIDKEFKSENVVNLIAVQQASQVYLRVRLLEVSRDVNNTFGITWNAIFNSRYVNVQANFGHQTNFGNSNGNGNSNRIGDRQNNSNFNIDVLIDALASEGLVTVLSEPNLTTLSGQPANFLVGGEFPVPVSQGNNGNVTVEFKSFGISLNFTPTVIKNDTINLSVHPKVSELSANGAVMLNGFSIPALSSREANTTVELRSGQSFAIAGLIQNNISSVLNQYPGLSEIPVLGNLFRSKQYQNHKSELVIVVTPYLVKPVASQSIQYPVSEYNGMDGAVENYQKGTSHVRDTTGFIL